MFSSAPLAPQIPNGQWWQPKGIGWAEWDWITAEESPTYEAQSYKRLVASKPTYSLLPVRERKSVILSTLDSKQICPLPWRKTQSLLSKVISYTNIFEDSPELTLSKPLLRDTQKFKKFIENCLLANKLFYIYFMLLFNQVIYFGYFIKMSKKNGAFA